MGIQGLLPLVKDACRPTNVKEFTGFTVGVDAYCLLHKGAVSCAEKLVKGEETKLYISYVLKYVRMLTSHNLTVIMVFDGASLPAKRAVDEQRRERRLKMRELGKHHLDNGLTSEAYDCFKQAVEITKEMVTATMSECRKYANVECIVAPYESDAQLAYFALNNIVQLVITEDSDLITFGCGKILFKMDLNGGGMLYEKEHLPKALFMSPDKFNFCKFRRMCIMSGCDYVSNLPGIGLARAKKFFAKTVNTDLRKVLKKIPSYLKMPHLQVTDEYIENFIKAEMTFLHQIVFDPLEKKPVPLSPFPFDLSPGKTEHCGRVGDQKIAYQMALGNLNPRDLKRMANYDPYKRGQNLPGLNLWSPASNLICSSVLSSSDNKHSKMTFQTPSSKTLIRPKVKSENFANTIGIMKNSIECDFLMQYNVNLLATSPRKVRLLSQGTVRSRYFANNAHASLNDDSVKTPLNPFLADARAAQNSVQNSKTAVNEHFVGSLLGKLDGASPETSSNGTNDCCDHNDEERVPSPILGVRKTRASIQQEAGPSTTKHFASDVAVQARSPARKRLILNDEFAYEQHSQISVKVNSVMHLEKTQLSTTGNDNGLPIEIDLTAEEVPSEENVSSDLFKPALLNKATVGLPRRHKVARPLHNNVCSRSENLQQSSITAFLLSSNNARRLPLSPKKN